MTTEAIIEDNIKLIYKISNMFYNVDKEDLLQAGKMGLIKAIKNYKFSEDTKFSTYAYSYIYGEMHLVATKKSMKINKDILKLCKVIEKTRYEYAQKLSRIPTNTEIANILNMDLSTVEYALGTMCEMISIDNDYDDQRSIIDRVAKKEDMSIEDKLTLYNAVNELPHPEKDIILNRYFSDNTQSEIAAMLNLSQVAVSRYEKKAMVRLKEYMCA